MTNFKRITKDDNNNHPKSSIQLKAVPCMLNFWGIILPCFCSSSFVDISEVGEWLNRMGEGWDLGTGDGNDFWTGEGWDLGIGVGMYSSSCGPEIGGGVGEGDGVTFSSDADGDSGPPNVFSLRFSVFAGSMVIPSRATHLMQHSFAYHTNDLLVNKL